MSSFIGHSIIGLSVSRLTENKTISWRWSIWLIFVAIAPDLNYIELWTLGSQTLLKNSHSIGFAMILPVLTILFLKYKNEINLLRKSLLVLTASFSHLLLDLLVGVFPKPYLWPLYSEKIRLPFGILPSAGKLDLQNYYFYKNLFIELGILIPFMAIIGLYLNRHKTKHVLIKQLLLVLTWFPFLVWGASLSRG